MAQFNVDLQVQGGVESPVNPVGSVDYTPAFTMTEALGKIFAKNVEEQKKAEAEQVRTAVLGEYSRKVSAIGQAVSSGQYSTSRGSSQSRILFDQYFGQYPQYFKELKEITSGFKEHGGVASAIDEEKAIFDERKAAIREASKDGINISLNDPQELQDQAIKLHREMIRTRNEAEERRKQRAEMRAESSEQRAALDHQERIDAFASVQRIGSESAGLLKMQADKLIEMGKTGDVAEARKQWQTLQGQWMATITQNSGRFPEAVGYWREFISSTNKYFEESLTGKDTAEASRNKVDVLLNTGKSRVLQDPEAARMFGAFNLAPNLGDILIRVGSEKQIKSVLGAALEGRPLGANQDPLTAKTAGEVFRKATQDIQQGKVDGSKLEGAKEELNKLSNSVLKDLSAADIYGMDNSSLKSLTGILTNPYFAQQVREGKVSAQAGKNAEVVMGRIYSGPIVDQAMKKLSTPFTIAQGANNPEHTVPIMSVIEVEYSDANGISFQPRSGKYLTPMEQGDRRKILAETSAATNALNEVIKVYAHLQGRTDYTNVFNEKKHEILPAIFPDPSMLKEGDVIDGHVYKGGNVRRKDNWEPVTDRSSDGRE